MTPFVLRSELAVAAPVEEVWTFFQTAQNLVEMTPPEQRVRIGDAKNEQGQSEHICTTAAAP